MTSTLEQSAGVATTLDLGPYWMPFTANRAFKASPRMVASAAGMYYRTPDGKRILDATAGLWCVNAGHGRERIAEAVAKQLATLDYASSFGLGHAGAFEYAERLAAILPGDLRRVFYAGSGSEAVDTALKIALAYHKMRGDAGRTRLIGRERAYHGMGFGGISVGGLVKNRRQFGPLLPGVDHLPHTHSLENAAFSRGQPAWGAHLADDVERLCALHDPGTIAAVIVEPVSGAAGVLVPPRGYLERLRELCTKHGILLIFDEVITGFGRLGSPFASSYFGVTPDLMTLAKGITNGSIPMGAVACREHVYQAFMATSEPGPELCHGYTYSGHPVACAAALATLDIYEEEGLFERAAELAPYWESALHSLRDLPQVVDVRNLGLVGAVQFTPEANAAAIAQRMWDMTGGGVLARPIVDSLAMSPPLIIEKSEIDRVVETIRDAARNP